VAALIRDEAGRCLLIQRPQSAKRMAGFWELPMWEEEGRNAPHLDSHPIPKDWIVLEELVGHVRHTITSNQLEVSVHAGRLQHPTLPPRARWILPTGMAQLPITTITRKALLLESDNC